MEITQVIFRDTGVRQSGSSIGRGHDRRLARDEILFPGHFPVNVDSMFSTAFPGDMALHTLLVAGSATGPLVDPPGASVLAAAVLWLQATLLGTVATTV